MRIVLTNSINGGDFLDFAFRSEAALQIQSQSSTAIVIRNPETGGITTFTGTGLFINEATETFGGTVTGWQTANSSGDPIVVTTGISWGLQAFVAAIESAFTDDNSGPLEALFSLQPVTVDARAYRQPAEIYADNLTSGTTIFGSDYGDRLEGGHADDVINPGDSLLGPRGDSLFASPGNDTYNFSDVSINAFWTDLVYQRLDAPIVATINGNTDSGTIVKGGAGTDTLTNMGGPLNWDGNGFTLFGSNRNDTFNITSGDNRWMQVFGGQGADSYTLDITGGGVRVNFSGNFDDWLQAPQGLIINVATGQIANDGYGNAETLSVRGSGSGLQIAGTNNADQITGSVRNETFLPYGGNDTIDGGGGFDRIRYDDSRFADGVTVNLGAGTATGNVGGVAFTHGLSRIEHVRGSRVDDTLIGSAGDERLEGRTGNDRLEGLGGNDTLFGDDGVDNLLGGDGNDRLYGGNGNDSLYGGTGDDTLVAGTGEEVLDGGTGNDLLIVDVSGAAPGQFVVEANLESGVLGGVGISTGRDSLVSIEAIEILGSLNARLTGDAVGNTLTGGEGTDTIIGGDGDDFLFGGASTSDLRDVIYGGDGADSMDGGHGNDELHGGEGNDTVLGGFGSDTVIGNAGDDLLAGGAGSDQMFGGPGNDTLNGGFGYDRLNGGTGADRFYHLGVADHASDWIQDYDAAGGDVLVFGQANATRAQFQINVANTPNAGAADVSEAFVIYRPTGQIMWALVDGDAQTSINLQIGGQVFDLLA